MTDTKSYDHLWEEDGPVEGGGTGHVCWESCEHFPLLKHCAWELTIPCVQMVVVVVVVRRRVYLLCHCFFQTTC